MLRPGEAQRSAIAVHERPDAAPPPPPRRLIAGHIGIAGKVAISIGALFAGDCVQGQDRTAAGRAVPPAASAPTKITEEPPPIDRATAADRLKAISPELAKYRQELASACAEMLASVHRRCESVFEELETRRQLPLGGILWKKESGRFVTGWRNSHARIKELRGNGDWRMAVEALLSLEQNVEQWEKYLTIFVPTQSASPREYVRTIALQERKLSWEESQLELVLRTSSSSDTTGRRFTNVRDPIVPRRFTRSWDEEHTHITEMHDVGLVRTRTRTLTNGEETEERFTYRPNGKKRVTESFFREGKLWQRASRRTFWPNETLQMTVDFRNDTETYWLPDGQALYMKQRASKGKECITWIYGRDGEAISSYRIENQRRNGRLTPDQYITLLADRLKTDDEFNAYFSLLIRYRAETGDQDHWKRPTETVEDEEGDCEDFSGLEAEVKRRQGEIAYVIEISSGGKQSHALCLQIIKKGGAYVAKTMCTYPTDINGRLKDFNTPRYIHGSGAKTIEEAIRLVLRKYEVTGLVGPPGVAIPLDGGITVLTIGPNGEQNKDVKPLSFFEPPVTNTTEGIARSK